MNYPGNSFKVCNIVTPTRPECRSVTPQQLDLFRHGFCCWSAKEVGVQEQERRSIYHVVPWGAN